jgi:hypothetical protein
VKKQRQFQDVNLKQEHLGDEITKQYTHFHVHYRRRWGDNIKMNLKQIEPEGVYWIHLARKSRVVGFLKT